MTDQTQVPTGPGLIPVSVSIGRSDEMTFATVNPETGRSYTAKEQFELRLRSPTWVKDASVQGTPAFADRERLVYAMAADEARRRGEDFADPHDKPAPDEPEPLEAPEAFRLPYGEDGAPKTPEEHQLDTAIRGWLSVGGFTRDSGTHLAEVVNNLLLSRDWNDEEVAQHQETSSAALRQVWGADFAKNVDLIGDLVEEVEAKQPGLIAFLEFAPFILREPLVAQHLLNVAQRRAAGL